MPTWFKIYLALFALHAVLSPIILIKNSVLGMRIFQSAPPRGLILFNLAGELALLLLMWAYWHPSFAATLGYWCLPLFFLALAFELTAVHKSTALLEAELETDPVLSPFRGPVFWLAFVLGFVCMAPAYATAGLLCLARLTGNP